MAEALHSRGSTVIVCARDEQALSATADRLPGVVALPCDLVDKQQREDLAAEVLRRFPDLDILVNNAGIQRYVDLKKGYAELKSGEDEIAINFVAVVELTALFIGHLLNRRSAAVINVSSGLGFMPMLSTPIYSATKAAVHTYTLVLRQQLAGTSVRVVEIVPPMVDTNLNRTGRDAARAGGARVQGNQCRRLHRDRRQEARRRRGRHIPWRRRERAGSAAWGIGEQSAEPVPVTRPAFRTARLGGAT